MADPSPTHPETPVEPGQLNDGNHNAPSSAPDDINRGAVIQHVSRIGGSGLVATKHFDEGEMITMAQGSICRLNGIFPHELDDRYDFKGSPQIRIDAIHTVAAAMYAYENGWGFRSSNRPFPPCIPVTTVMSLLNESPTKNVKKLVTILQNHLGNAPEPSDHNDTEGTTNNSADPAWGQSTEARALQVLRFMDGALVAQDLSPRHLVYTHFTSYVSRHLPSRRQVELCESAASSTAFAKSTTG